VPDTFDLAGLIDAYGYPFVFLGTVFEGETVLALAGFAAHRGFLRLALVIAVAALGGFVGDQLWFEVGRRAGPRVVARFPRLAPGLERMHRLLARRPDATVLGIRFVYGLRSVGPIALGMSEIPRLRFLALNALGAVVWAALFASLGWLLGEALERVLGDLRRVEGAVFLAILAIGLAAALLRHRRRGATA